MPDKRMLLFILLLATTFFCVNTYFNVQQDKRQAISMQEQLQKKAVAPEEKLPSPAEEALPQEERFYVLENATLQLVFSNRGGALSEINLPFTSETNRTSVVLPIAFDRILQSEYPYNAHFPATTYLTPGATTPLSPSTLGGYYPLLRRKLILSPTGEAITLPARYYALNVVSDYPEVAELFYRVVAFDQTHIVFEAQQPHRRITKTFTLEPETSGAPYCFHMTLQIEGDSRGLWLTSGVPEVELISDSPASALKYQLTRRGKSEMEKIDLPKEKEVITVSSLSPNWVVNSNGYFALLMHPLQAIVPGYRVQHVPGATAVTKLVDIDRDYDRFSPKNYPGYSLLLPLKNQGEAMTFRIFAGPLEGHVLKTVESHFTDPKTGENPNYSACQTFFGWFSFISEPFARFLYLLMSFFHQITNSWALSIFLLTLALRLMLYPLNTWSIKSMRRMQELSPQITAIQAKYKKDQRKAQMEIMNLYREKKVNPFTGCFPLLIQMPFLIGMFDLLKSTFDLRGAPFIPGWIDNLTAPDILFQWHYPLPFIGTSFHLLPLLLAVVMYLQQKMSSNLPKDPKLLTDQQRQQKFMGNVMVVVFSVMFYNFPSGLNLYWLSSMLLGILQQYWMTRRSPATAKGTIPSTTR